jgi:hypothetical protein
MGNLDLKIGNKTESEIRSQNVLVSSLVELGKIPSAFRQSLEQPLKQQFPTNKPSSAFDNRVS